MGIGEKIRTCRKEARLTQQQLAERLGVSCQAVSCWENEEYLPEFGKLRQLADVFEIPLARLVDQDYAARWDLHDRMFSEEHMYTFVRSAAVAKGLQQTATVLPLVKKWHEGQTRKGKDAVPYLYHPLMIACHALALGLGEDDIVAAALLHDVVEDCGVTAEELPVSDTVRTAVQLVSFQKEPNETKAHAKARYYEKISKNRVAAIVKVLDRCNNISTMATAFSREKMAEYIDETESCVMPLLDCIKQNYPECSNAAFLLKYHMRSVLESLKRTL